MNSSIKKLLSEVQSLCVDISLANNGQYFAICNYCGSANCISIYYSKREEEGLNSIYVAESIKLKTLKIAKRKLKKLLEENK